MKIDSIRKKVLMSLNSSGLQFYGKCTSSSYGKEQGICQLGFVVNFNSRENRHYSAVIIATIESLYCIFDKYVDFGDAVDNNIYHTFMDIIIKSLIDIKQANMSVIAVEKLFIYKNSHLYTLYGNSSSYVLEKETRGSVDYAKALYKVDCR